MAPDETSMAATCRHRLPLPDPALCSGPLRLRAWTAADIPAIVAACQDPTISRFSPVIPWPYRRSDAVAWLVGQEPARREGASVELAAVSTGTGRLLGAVALSSVDLTHRRAGVGYWLAADERGHGFATMATRLLARWAFDHLGLAKLELTTDPDNEASQRVAERCGFVREGLLRSHLVVRHDGRRRDSISYGLLPHELS